jgi:hypothetical protein
MITTKNLSENYWWIKVLVKGDTRDEVDKELDKMMRGWAFVYSPMRSRVSYDGHKYVGIFERSHSCD